MPGRTSIPIISLLLILVTGLACAFPFPAPSDGEEDQKSTEAAATSSIHLAQTTIASTVTTHTTAPLLTPSPTLTASASPTPSPSTATATPPPGGVSLNCDGTYQRVRITDHGPAGKMISVDDWDGSSWVNVWNVSSGDPNTRQMMPEAGYYEFGACQKMVIVPMRYSGPHLWYELGIYTWNGSVLAQVYFNEGYHGEWSKTGAVITFREASTLGGSPLEPCEWMTLEHEWDGTAFNQIGSLLEPVPACTPSVP